MVAFRLCLFEISRHLYLQQLSIAKMTLDLLPGFTSYDHQTCLRAAAAVTKSEIFLSLLPGRRQRGAAVPTSSR